MKHSLKTYCAATCTILVMGCSTANMSPDSNRSMEHMPLQPVSAASPISQEMLQAQSVREQWPPKSELPVSQDLDPVKPATKWEEQGFRMAMKAPVSTFSSDVDTASYSLIRRSLNEGVLPRLDEIRTEEMLNYFHYDLPDPKEGEPFSVTSEVSSTPWSADTHVVRIGIKTKALDRGQAPPRNLVFLLDVSGSMNNHDKLPLLKASLRALVDTLDDNDSVAVVVYAGGSGVVLNPTTGDRKLEILDAVDSLTSHGGTNGAGGIELAYELAAQNQTENSVNRVILATDGDFNVGPSSEEELKSLIEEKRKSGLTLSVLGFGGSSNDLTMETLADNGNGNYSHIDSLSEAKKVLVEEAGATLVTVAKDVKFQVEMDPKVVKRYRLIGYRNRRLANQDFANDQKDAGDLGAGHSVTALYEVQLNDEVNDENILNKVGLQEPRSLGEVRLRYKQPKGDSSELMELPLAAEIQDWDDSSADQQWALAVAGFGRLLEGSLSFEQLRHVELYSLMQPVMADDPDAYQAEFYSLVKKSEGL